MKSLAQKTVLSLATALLLAGAPVGAHAENSNASTDRGSFSQQASSSKTISDERALREEFIRNKVPSNQREALIRKILSGVRPDSLTPGAQPISVIKTGNTETKRYKDGSYVILSVEIPQTNQSAASDPLAVSGINGCSVYSGSGYRVFKNCTVYANWGAINIAFVADWENIQGGPSRINRVYNPTQRCAGVQCETPRLWIIKAVADSGGSAAAQAQSRVTAAWGSWEVWVQLRVNSSGGWALSS